jgi:hypothetical protein
MRQGENGRLLKALVHVGEESKLLKGKRGEGMGDGKK